jgi:hypothetical protein
LPDGSRKVVEGIENNSKQKWPVKQNGRYSAGYEQHKAEQKLIQYNIN